LEKDDHWLRLVRDRSDSATDAVGPHADYAVTAKYEPEWLEQVKPSDFALKSYQHHALLTVPMTVSTLGISAGIAGIVPLLRAIPNT
jgi:hypothetical protein